MGTEQHAESGAREAQPEPAHELEHEQGENGKDQAETESDRRHGDGDGGEDARDRRRQP